MIVGKTAVFGHGDLKVSHNNDTLQISEFDTKSDLGEEVPKDIVELDSINLTYGKDMLKLLDQLLNVNKDNSIVKFRDYILDFTAYSHFSVETLCIHLDSMINSHLEVAAC